MVIPYTNQHPVSPQELTQILSVRIVAYQGAGCDPARLPRHCPTWDAHSGDANHDDNCARNTAEGASCEMRAVLRGEVEPVEGVGGSVRVRFESPLTAVYLIHVRQESTTLRAALQDCSFTPTMATETPPSSSLAAVPGSPFVKVVNTGKAAGNPADFRRGFWLKRPISFAVEPTATAAVPRETICSPVIAQRPPSQGRHLHWVTAAGEVGCLSRSRYSALGPLRLIIVGDSVGRELASAFEAIVKANPPQGVRVEYSELKPRPKPSPDQPLEAIRAILKALTLQLRSPDRGETKGRAVLLINPASLWWVAYGELVVFRQAIAEIAKLLEEVPAPPQPHCSALLTPTPYCLSSRKLSDRGASRLSSFGPVPR